LSQNRSIDAFQPTVPLFHLRRNLWYRIFASFFPFIMILNIEKLENKKLYSQIFRYWPDVHNVSISQKLWVSFLSFILFMFRIILWKTIDEQHSCIDCFRLWLERGFPLKSRTLWAYGFLCPIGGLMRLSMGPQQFSKETLDFFVWG
jgi:hypothetical protein